MRRFLFFILSFGFVAGSEAATLTAASASYADVNAAVAQAVDGDTVQVPAGSATWGSTLNLNKSITLKGAGTGSGATLTKITFGGALPFINIALPADKPVRVTGFYFDNLTSAANTDKTIIRINGRNWSGVGQELTRVRVDHNTFNQGARQIFVLGWAYGVIDHNLFLNPDIAVGFSGDDNFAWQRPIAAGTADAMFIEDNQFIVDNNSDTPSFDEPIYHAEGSRSVTRYNTFDSTLYTKQDSPFFDTHGNLNMHTGASGSDMRGQPLVEVYNNAIHVHHAWEMMNVRGGSVLYHDNVMTTVTGGSLGLLAEEEESWTSGGPFSSKPATTVWPAQDQINNSFFWNNTLNGAAITDLTLNDAFAGAVQIQQAFIQKDRDYFMHAPAAQGGKIIWTDPSKPGLVGNETFIPSGPNAYYPYTPYTYPHPLTTGTEALPHGHRWYVNNGVTASGDGQSWGTAWKNFANINWPSVQPGDVVCLAGGNYSETLSPQRSGTFSAPITIKRATISDAECGSGSAGWSGTLDSQVVITGNPVSVNFNAPGPIDHIVLDGQIDSGIKINVPNLSGNIDGKGIAFGKSVSGIVLKHLDVAGPDGPGSINSLGDNRCIEMIAWNGSSYEPLTDITISNNRLHGCVNLMYVINASNVIIENNKFYDALAPSPMHTNVVITAASRDIVFRYNDITNWNTEGILMDPTSSAGSKCGKWSIYGNVWHDGASGGLVSGGDRVLESQFPGQGPVFFYNNVIANVWMGVAGDGFLGGHLIRGAENNIFWNVYAAHANYHPGQFISSGLPDSDYDLFDLPNSEINGLTTANSPFIDIASKNYHLAANSVAINKGTALALDGYQNKDFDGNSRGINGAWDIGAYEFVGPVGHQWYVRSTCANNGDGTAQACASSSGGAGAWKGFPSVGWSSIQPGDSLFLVGGETYTGTLTIPKSGTPVLPITISVSGSGSAVIDLQNVSSLGINLNGNSYITIDGLRGNAVAGDSNYGLKFINMIGNSAGVYDANGGGNNKVFHIECSGSSSSGGDDFGGIRLSGGLNYEIAYNWIHGPGAGIADHWWISGIVVWGQSSGTSYTNTKIHHNKVENLQHDGIKSNSNVSIYNNDVSEVYGSGHSDSTLCQSGDYCAIYGNFIHSLNDQQIYLDNLTNSSRGHIRVYNNVVDSNGFGVVIDPEGSTGSNWDDVVIVNNTFYRTGGEAIRWSSRGSLSNLVIQNNIVGKANVSGYHQINIPLSALKDSSALDYNVYFTGSNNAPKVLAQAGTANTFTLAELQALSPAREVHGKYMNTTLVNPAGGDYRLSSLDTAARDAGLSLSSYFSVDKDNIARFQGASWDIGAYEFNGGGALIVYHPADTNSDYLIILNEATKYGACWKNSSAFADCPAGIAIDYAVRAGTLWAGSATGQYQYNSANACPLCWEVKP